MTEKIFVVNAQTGEGKNPKPRDPNADSVLEAIRQSIIAKEGKDK